MKTVAVSFFLVIHSLLLLLLKPIPRGTHADCFSFGGTIWRLYLLFLPFVSGITLFVDWFSLGTRQGSLINEPLNTVLSHLHATITLSQLAPLSITKGNAFAKYIGNKCYIMIWKGNFPPRAWALLLKFNQKKRGGKKFNNLKTKLFLNLFV